MRVECLHRVVHSMGARAELESHHSWHCCAAAYLPHHTLSLTHPNLLHLDPSHPTCSTEYDNLAVDAASCCPFSFFARLSFPPKDVMLTSLLSLITILSFNSHSQRVSVSYLPSLPIFSEYGPIP
jgi:hypothetical protein